MYGDERVRFCGQCSQNVYNLSALTREEAEDLIRRKDGQLCVRFYKRRDGTILTSNCPVGLRRIKERLTGTSAAVIKGILTLLACISPMWWRDGNRGDSWTLPVTGALPVKHQIMGEFALPAPIMGALEVRAPRALTVKRSEAFVRDRAILQVTPRADSSVVARAKTAAVVRIVISEDGEVDEALLVKGDELLRDLAEEAAIGWKFKPIRINGAPARVESTLSFRFRR